MHFKKAALRLTAAALTVSAMLTPVLAATGTVTAGGSSLRLRAQANTSSQILRNLPDGSQVDVLGTAENGWYKVSVSGMTGFVSGDFLTVVDDAPVPTAEAPAVRTAEAPAAEPAAEQKTLYIQVTLGPLNIRSGPSTEYSRVGSLYGGQMVKALEKVDGWYHIENGYVSGDYVKEVSVDMNAAASGKGQEVANYAMQFLGYRYVYGGASPSGFDCSGFTSYVYKQFGYYLNRCAADQLDNGVPVSRDQLQPGDIVIFKKGNTTARATHVGLYIGNGNFIHASNPSSGVKINNLSQDYYATGLVGCRRIIV